MRVLHVDTARTWRGGQTQLRHLLAARPTDLLVAHDGAPIALAARDLGVDVHPLRALPWLGRRVDVVAAHTSRAHDLALLSGLRPVVHRRVDFRPRTPVKPRLARGFVAVSHAVAAVLSRAGVPRDRVAVVYDGVAPRAPVGRADLGAGPVVAAVGALVDHKGHAVLIDAMAHVAARAVIAGEGRLRDALLARIRDRGLADRVQLLGHRTDVPELLAAADVLAHPSVEEGLGQVLIEATAAGVPIVASAVGGIPEVVRHGRTGLLVPPGDPRALAAAITRALTAPPPGDRAVAAAFSVDAMVRGTEAAYRRFA